MQCNSCLVALYQVTLITPRRPSTGTPACQSRTRPTPTATSARTAPRTRTRTSRTRSSHSRRRRRSRLRRRTLRRTSCRPRPRPPSRAYTPGTGVEGPRRVRGRDGTGRDHDFFSCSELQGAETFFTSLSRCPVVTVQHVCAQWQASLGPGCVVSHPPLQQRAVAEVKG